MGGSASYRLAKKIADEKNNGASQDEIDELERKREIARKRESQKRKNNKPVSLRMYGQTDIGKISGDTLEQWKKAVARANKNEKLDLMGPTRIEQTLKRRGIDWSEVWEEDFELD